MSIAENPKSAPPRSFTKEEIQTYFDPYSPEDATPYERLLYWSLAIPDMVAFRFLVDGKAVEELTYKQLDHSARAIAAELASRGIKGKPALLLFPPGLEFVKAFMGCHYAGAIPVPAYPPRRNRNMGRINAISENCQAAVALSSQEVISRNEGMLDDAPSLQKIPWIATEKIPQELASDWVRPKVELDDPGLIQYTSGSTGSPKGVVLTQRNLMANCRMITALFGQKRADSKGVSWLPLYHDMGLIGGVLEPMYLGGSISLMSPVAFLTRPVRWLRAISDFGATITGAPNFAYELCVEKVAEEELDTLDLSTWKVAFNGAEPIRAETLKRFTEKFARCGFQPETHYPCYGMAETTLIVTGCDHRRQPIVRHFDRRALDDQKVIPVESNHERSRPLVSSGNALLGTAVKVVDPETCELLGDQEIGEIWVQSPSVGQGYWQNEAETENTFHAQLANQPDAGEFLRTGDLGFLDAGEVYITGRLKDLIIIRGVNKYPQDIEATVESSSPRLRRAGAAAFAVEQEGNEQLIVVCEVERGPNKVWSDVLQAVRSNVVAEHELPPDGVILVRSGSVPKTSSGKVQRKLCRQLYLDDKLLVVARWCSWEEQVIEAEQQGSREADEARLDEQQLRVVPIVCNAVKQVAKERAGVLDVSTNVVVDLGLDSLERLQIAYALEETFGGRIPDDVLQEIETVGEITDAIIEYVGSEPVNEVPGEVSSRPKLPKNVEIPDSYYVIDKMPEFIRVQQMKALMTSTGVRNPFFSVHEGRIGDTTQIEGKELISYASYNYLGYSCDEDVIQQAQQAFGQYGTSVSASRLVSGEKTIHKDLENELAEFLGVEDVITFPAGHGMNETVIGHVLGPGDLIIHDSLAHNCIIKGAELSGARRRPFEHNDWKQLDDVLSEIRHEYRRVLIALEGLYSMDGDFPDLPRFVEIKKKHKAWMFLDEAHSIGTLGKTGRGVGEMLDVDRQDIEFWMGTLSKSLGSCGGFIGGQQKLIEYLRYTTPGFVFAAGINPGSVGAALASLRNLSANTDRVDRLRHNSARFLERAKQAGLDTGLSDRSPIIPIIIGDSLKALRASEGLFHQGINAQPILHPAVAEEEARVRFFITALHTDEQIDHTVDIVRDVVSKL